MNDADPVAELIRRMVALARAGGSHREADALAWAGGRLEDDRPAALAALVAMFGGMGSLNDVILYADGQPLIAENREFAALRTRLFEQVHLERGTA
jgi:hypothetical protein